MSPSWPFQLILLAPYCLVLLMLVKHTRGANASRPIVLALGSMNENPFRPELRGEGVVLFRLHNASLTRVLTLPTSLVQSNPTYLAPAAPYLYAVNSLTPDGALTVIRLPSRVSRGVPGCTRRDAHVITVTQPGQRPTHVSVLPTRGSKRRFGCRVLAVANVQGGTVYTYRHCPPSAPKRVGIFTVPPRLAAQLTNPALTFRQTKPNPHMVLPFKVGLLVPDLGADVVFYLRVGQGGGLRLRQKIKLRPGDGPRHVAKRGDVVYVLNELSQSIAVLKDGGRCGGWGLAECGRVNVLDRGPVEDGLAAAIRVSEDKRFLYASMRIDTKEEQREGLIAGFKLAKNGGIAGKLGEWRSGGVRPRDFFLVEGGVAVANRDSNNLVIIERDMKTGRLGAIKATTHVRSPTSVVRIW